MLSRISLQRIGGVLMGDEAGGVRIYESADASAGRVLVAGGACASLAAAADAHKNKNDMLF